MAHVIAVAAILIGATPAPIFDRLACAERFVIEAGSLAPITTWLRWPISPLSLVQLASLALLVPNGFYLNWTNLGVYSKRGATRFAPLSVRR
jgi:hypothetical protein